MTTTSTNETSKAAVTPKVGDRVRITYEGRVAYRYSGALQQAEVTVGDSDLLWLVPSTALVEVLPEPLKIGDEITPGADPEQPPRPVRRRWRSVPVQAVGQLRPVRTASEQEARWPRARRPDLGRVPRGVCVVTEYGVEWEHPDGHRHIAGGYDRLGAESVVEGGKVGVWAPRPVRVMQRASVDWQPVVTDEAA